MNSSHLPSKDNSNSRNLSNAFHIKTDNPQNIRKTDTPSSQSVHSPPLSPTTKIQLEPNLQEQLSKIKITQIQKNFPTTTKQKLAHDIQFQDQAQ